MIDEAMAATALSGWNGNHHTALTRYEFKYLIRPELAQAAVRFLAPYVEMDEHCRERSTTAYTVRSIYFDSPDFECFHEKLGGQKFREKFRIRSYDHPGSAPLFLENKIKNGLAYFKDRVSLNAGDLEAVENADCEGLGVAGRFDGSRRALDRLFFHMYRRAYSPVALVVYEREAYICPSEDTIRVTFDRNLRASMFPSLGQIHKEEGLEHILYDWIILEIKFTQTAPRWMGRLCPRFHLRRQTCSKYCTSVAHFLGEVPSLKDGLARVWTI